MKLGEAISRFDSLKNNTYQQEEKIRWISQLDAMVKRQIIDTHEGGEAVAFTGYDGDTELTTQLLMDEPYDAAYIYWLEAQVDYANGEYTRYNNSIEQFNTLWQAYRNDYNATHTPKGKTIKYF